MRLIDDEDTVALGFGEGPDFFQRSKIAVRAVNGIYDRSSVAER
jgi:hypothetical protein